MQQKYLTVGNATIKKRREENHIINKDFVKYVKNNLVMLIKNAIKFKITVFTPENIVILH